MDNALRFLHVLAAMVWIAGVIGGNFLYMRAGASSDLPFRRFATKTAAQLTGRLLIPGAVLAGIFGFVTALQLGYSVTSGWVLYAEVLYVISIVIGIAYYGPWGKRVDAAADAGDNGALDRLLRSSSLRAVTAIDSLILLLILYLMIVKPA